MPIKLSTEQDPRATPLGKPITSDAFARSMEMFGSFGVGDSFAIAVSGGPDSMALCRLAHAWAASSDAKIFGLTVDHQLRAEARVEADSVKVWLADFGMSHEVLTWKEGAKIKHLDRSPQADARDARFELLCNWCHENGIQALMTAHHADDQAETFLYRLIRGSGVDGLASMAMETHRDGVRLLKPLLPFPKVDLVATCEEFGQAWVNDPSNDHDSFTRVRLRKIMAALEDEGLERDRLLKTVSHMQRAKAAIDSAVDAFMKTEVAGSQTGSVHIDLEALLALPNEIALRALARCLTRVSGAVYPPRFDSLEGLYRALGATGWSDRTLHGCQIRLKGAQIVVLLEERKR